MYSLTLFFPPVEARSPGRRRNVENAPRRRPVSACRPHPDGRSHYAVISASESLSPDSHNRRLQTLPYVDSCRYNKGCYSDGPNRILLTITINIAGCHRCFHRARLHELIKHYNTSTSYHYIHSELRSDKLISQRHHAVFND